MVFAGVFAACTGCGGMGPEGSIITVVVGNWIEFKCAHRRMRSGCNDKQQRYPYKRTGTSSVSITFNLIAVHTKLNKSRDACFNSILYSLFYCRTVSEFSIDGV